MSEATPITSLARGEEVLKDGYCGLGEGSRGKTFAPGHLYLTDRRLIIESRLATDRSTVAYALAAITRLEALPDGFVFDIAAEGLTEVVILWGEVTPWVAAVEAARQQAPALHTAVKQSQQRTPVENRRRVIVFGVVGVVAAVILLIALCIVIGSVWLALQGA